MRTLIYVLAVVILFGCKSEVKRSYQTLFNVDSLVEKQISLLEQVNAKGTKLVTVGASRDTVEFSGIEQWKVELEVFKQLDMINRPANQDLYTVRRDEPNMVVIAPVKDTPKSIALTLTYDSADLLVGLDAEYNNHTAIFSTRSLMHMSFATVGSEQLLTSYRVSGGQKLMMGDSATFSLKAAVTIPDRK